MKIAFDVSDLATNRADGTTVYTRALAQALPTLSPQDTWEYFAPSVAPEDMQRTLPKNVGWHNSPFPKYWTQLRLPWDLLRIKPDVLFMPIQQLPYLRPRNLKTVAVVHDLAFHKYPQQFTRKDWLLLHVFTAQVARDADHVIAVSQSTANDIARYYGRTKNVHVVHHGVDHSRFRVPTAEEKKSSWETVHQAYPQLSGPYLLYVGQIQPRKNLIRLLDAFELLHKKNPDLQLVIAGGHGWLQAEINQKITASPAANNIIQLGRVSDELLPALYWHAEVFCYVSLYEGFGMPMLEAMASGCPVVTANNSCLPEVAGNAAVLVDAQNVTSIESGIAEAMAQKESLRQKGITQSEKFNWQKTAQETLKILYSA